MFYGTEVYEVNQNLRDLAITFAKKATLQKSSAVAKYCVGYNIASASSAPSILTADVTASNVFFHGSRLSKSIEKACAVFTGGKAVYGLTAQEE